MLYCPYKCVIQYINSPTVTDEVGRRIQFDMTMNSYYSINQGQAVKSSGFRFSKLIDGYGLSLAHISPLIAGNIDFDCLESARPSHNRKRTGLHNENMNDEK